MKIQHTPGPWEIDDVLNQLDEEYDGQDIIISKEGCPIATVRGTDDMSCIDDDEELDRIALEIQASAKLIAAAPELLESLDYLLKWPNSELAHNIAKSAIKKATE